jgi:hypothetical protein
VDARVRFIPNEKGGDKWAIYEKSSGGKFNVVASDLDEDSALLINQEEFVAFRLAKLALTDSQFAIAYAGLMLAKAMRKL